VNYVVTLGVVCVEGILRRVEKAIGALPEDTANQGQTDCCEEKGPSGSESQ
jgi:hypothetical protein